MRADNASREFALDILFRGCSCEITDAEKLCDKVAIIKSGKLIKSGTMDEVKGDDSLEDVFLELEEKDA